jgi:hypothetical protein
MRKIVAGLFISLDGVTEAPENWQLAYVNDEMFQAIESTMAESDTMLLGRRTYQDPGSAVRRYTGVVAGTMPQVSGVGMAGSSCAFSEV